MERQTCIFSGDVQGVGFRYTVQNLALRYNVQGYVRNTPDGRVELVMEGPPTEMASLLRDIQDRMNGYINHVQIASSPGTAEFHRFNIRL